MSSAIEMTLTQWRDALAAGAVSSVEATRAYLDAIAARDGTIRAYTQVFAERALERAAAADAARAAGRPGGLLAGVPVSIKDNMCTDYGRTTCASGRRAGLLGLDGSGTDGLGHPHLDVEPLAVDLDRRRPFDERLGLLVGRWRSRSCVDVREVEVLLDPLGGVLDRHEVGVAQDRQVGGDRGGHTLDDQVFERADRAPDRRVAVFAPHDQLADQVVVVLADLVAGFVPGVEPHTEPVGCDEPVDRPG